MYCQRFDVSHESRNDTIRTCEAHSHPGANHGAVGSQVHEDCGRQRHEAAREEAVEGANNDHGSEAMRRNQTESQDARDESTRNDHVHRASTIRDEVGDDAAED